MKRLSVLVCILALAALPAMVSAQGLPTLGGMPGIGSLFGSTGTCGEAKPGLVFPPTFYVGWVGGGDVSFGGGLDTNIAGITELDQDYRLDSVALGISGGFEFSDRISIIASGWWMIPGTTRSGEDYAGQAVFLNREWSADTNWWWVDALAAYDVGGGAAILGGFRYERFETKFRNARNIAGVGLPGDEANGKSNAYIPLFGLLYTTGSGSGVFSAYAIGFPAVPGHSEYRETLFGVNRLNASGDYNRGYFFETRLEYKRRFMGEANLGAFFTYNVLEAKVSSTVDVDPGVGTAGFEGSFNRNAVIVGGSLNLPFRLPFM